MRYDLFGYPIIEKFEILRIPYMGSKNSIALQLFRKMLDMNPDAKYFVDLFGGGGSMSFTALQIGMGVVYNEKQASLVNFIRYIIDRIKNGEKSKYGIFPESFYKFITREDFKKLKADDSVYGQFARICYSFGNNQRTYLFNPEIEKTKHLAHNIVVFKCRESLEEFNDLMKVNIKLSNRQNWNDRRLDFQRKINQREFGELEQLEQLQRLQQLEQLQRLQQLQQLERLQRLQLFNLDYKDVIINTPPEQTIVYLDPPYRNTTKYIEGINHDELDDYFRNLPYMAFMSEYEAPFESVMEIQKAQLMNNSKEHKSYITEKLFINLK